MQIQWTIIAQNDLDDIEKYIASDSAVAAGKVLTKIFNSVETLSTHPSLGRPGRFSRTRELIVSSTPYIIIYRLNAQDITILRVLHGAMKVIL